MFKKKTKIINLYAEKYENIVDQYLQAQMSVQSRAETSLVKKLAVEVYPEGPDKQAAQRDLDEVQQSLICAIGSMDARRQEMIDFYITNFEKIKDENYKNPQFYSKSHETVEFAIKMFYRR